MFNIIGKFTTLNGLKNDLKHLLEIYLEVERLLICQKHNLQISKNFEKQPKQSN